MYRIYRKIIRYFFKPKSRFTVEEAIKIAREYDMESEVTEALKFGFTPDEALEEWDLYPY